MGFTMVFLQMTAADQQGDGDRDEVRRFLASRGLVVHLDDPSDFSGTPSGDLRYANGDPLLLDGHPTDLRIDDLDGPWPVAANIDHANLGPEECSFLFDLCVAGRLFAYQEQCKPYLLIPARNHHPDVIAEYVNTCLDGEPDLVAYVDTAEEFQAALRGSAQPVFEWMARVIAEGQADRQ